MLIYQRTEVLKYVLFLYNILTTTIKTQVVKNQSEVAFSQADVNTII